MDDEVVTLDGQFFEFSKLLDTKRDGTTITLYRSDYWLRQSKLLDDRKLTMTETGLLWWKKFSKTEIDYDEWYEYLTDLCEEKKFNQEIIEMQLVNCGLPGATQVVVPIYREFFDTYKPKSKMLF